MQQEDVATTVAKARASYAETGMTVDEADERIIQNAIRLGDAFPNLRLRAKSVIQFVQEQHPNKGG